MKSLTITIRNDSDAFKLYETLKSQEYPFTLTFSGDEKKKRTPTQNAALHLWFSMVAKALNEAGHDFRATLKDGVEVPWDERLVKEYMWKPIQKILIDEESTTKADRNQYSEVYEVLNRHLGEKLGIHVPWPSQEALLYGS